MDPMFNINKETFIKKLEYVGFFCTKNLKKCSSVWPREATTKIWKKSLGHRRWINFDFMTSTDSQAEQKILWHFKILTWENGWS